MPKDTKIVSMDPFHNGPEEVCAYYIKSLEEQLAEARKENEALRQDKSTKDLDDSFNIIKQREIFFKKILEPIWKKRKQILKQSNSSSIVLWKAIGVYPCLYLYSNHLQYLKNTDHCYCFGSFFKIKFIHWKHLPMKLAEANIDPEAFEKEVLKNIREYLK